MREREKNKENEKREKEREGEKRERTKTTMRIIKYVKVEKSWKKQVLIINNRNCSTKKC